MGVLLNHLPSLENLDARLRAWRKAHNTPAKVAAAHRTVLLARVTQSMEFEKEPVSMARLQTLLKGKNMKELGSENNFFSRQG